jgi:hypothetical protein
MVAGEVRWRKGKGSKRDAGGRWSVEKKAVA